MTIAHIQATFHDWRTVKTRKMLQIIFEVPLEKQGEVLTMLGPPDSANPSWHVIAPLKDESEDKPAKTPRPMNTLPLSQQAALLGEREAFWRFARERCGADVWSQGKAADFIRDHCGVSTRADIHQGSEAGTIFLILKGDFDAWMANP
jgi:hypothetical protein